NINFPLGSGNLDECIKKYQGELDKKVIDVQILGIGSNGHIAFNEPGTSFDSHVHTVKLDTQTREDNKRFFNNLDEVPEFAISMGIKDIMAAKKIIILANGKNKKYAVNEMLSGLKTEEFPASILMDHPDVTLIVDSEAGEDIE
ncbi:MAG: 6-phosphogluconolactonase, partial [Erysipelotrichales bacterium]